ncbi:MAG: hypothetical protein A7316_05380 [Candidatus Altiarchaeales archaeon WOR_SM1_86-2]|nr:MAG: hypothetical protein A7316_05380 [Candidatus Altiarchaeales archaeon WOR_SM1_86-2]
MIKLGPAGVPVSSKDRSTVGGIKMAAELSLGAMEVEFVRGVSMSDPTAKKVGNAAKEAGIDLSVHCPYYINLCSAEEEKIAASKKRILDSAERADAMGAMIIVFHPGFYGKLKKEDAFEMVEGACSEMADKVRDNDWKVLLGLETTGKVSQFGTLEEIMDISRKIKECVPVVDFAHIYARAQGRIDYGDVLDKVRGYKHLHSHFSCIEYSKGGERRHLTLDANEPDFRELAEEILKRKQDITIISESPVLERDSLKMKSVFEELGYGFE